MKIIEDVKSGTLERDDGKSFGLVFYSSNYNIITLDGTFNLEEIQALVEYMKDKSGAT